MNGDAWPQDFWESCYYTDGRDSAYGDVYKIAVYAGHGNGNPAVSSFLFGAPHNGACTADMSNNIRLGQMSGASAGYAMYGASCVMSLNKLPQILNQWLHQQFGFHNSPSIDYYQLGDFYAQTNYVSNRTAWLDELEDGQYWWSSDNSPIVVSRSAVSDSDAWNKHTTFRFAYGDIFFEKMYGGPACGQYQTANWWYYTYIDNGGC